MGAVFYAARPPGSFSTPQMAGPPLVRVPRVPKLTAPVDFEQQVPGTRPENVMVEVRSLYAN